MSNTSNLSTDLKSQRYLNEKEVAALTGIPVQTLRNQRHWRKGLPYRKFGKLVRYSLPEVLTAMESCKIDPEAM